MMKLAKKTWTDEQRTKWDAMKSELGGVESQIEREESLRSTDALFVEEQRQIETESKPVIDVDAKRSQAFNSFLRRGLGELRKKSAKLWQNSERKRQAQTIKVVTPCLKKCRLVLLKK